MNFDNIIQYCVNLELNNNRTWFHEHHKQYEAATAEFRELLEQMRIAICDAAPELKHDILYCNVKDWCYRIPRDMRMPRNRQLPPYNPSFRAYISPDRKSNRPVGYYVGISPDGCVFGTGLWYAESDITDKVRRYIQYNFEEFDEIIKNGNLFIDGDSLRKVPKGFPEDSPAAKWIKFKNWNTMFGLDSEDLADFKDFCALITEWVERAEPFRLFLLRALNSGTTLKESLTDFYNAGRWN